MRIRIITILLACLMFSQGVFILNGLCIDNSPQTSVGSRQTDVDISANDYYPGITDNTNYKSGYNNTGLDYFHLNLTIFDDDDENATTMNGSRIMNVEVDLNQLGIGVRDLYYKGNGGLDPVKYNLSRGEGWWSRNFTIPPLDSGRYEFQINVTDNGMPFWFQKTASLSNITLIVYQQNRPPEKRTAADGGVFAYQVDEDSGRLEINLNDTVFFDRDLAEGPFSNTDPDSLTFYFWGGECWLDSSILDVHDFGNFTMQFNESNPDEVWVIPNENTSTIPAGEKIKFNATDSHGEWVVAEVTYKLMPINDPPVLYNAFDWVYNNTNASAAAEYTIACTQNHYVELHVNGSDIDGDLLKFILEDFYPGTTLLPTAPFILNENTGLISFIPTNNAVGNFFVNISVFDGTVSVWDNFTFDVGNVNDPAKIKNIVVHDNKIPIINHRVNLTVAQDEIFNATLIVTDPDVKRGFEGELMINVMEAGDEPHEQPLDLHVEPISNDTFNLSLTPLNAHVGMYLFNISVGDIDGPCDYVLVKFIVNNKNDPPHIYDVTIDDVPVPITAKMVNFTDNPLIKSEPNMTLTIVADDIDFQILVGETLHWTQQNKAIPSKAFFIENIDNNTRLAKVTIYGEQLSNGIHIFNFTVSDNGTPPLRDYVLIKIVVNITEIIEPPKNTAPTLSLGSMNPKTGDTETEFTFTVHYYDEDGDTPTSIFVVIDGVNNGMTLGSENASNGVYKFSTKLGKGNHTYYFTANDGEFDAVAGDETAPVSQDNAIGTSDVIKIQEKKEDGAEETDWTLYIILIIIIIIILLILGLVVSRRKKPEEELEEEEALEEAEDAWEAEAGEAAVEEEFAGEEEEMGEWRVEDEEAMAKDVEIGIVTDEELFDDSGVGVSKPAKGKLPKKPKKPKKPEQEELEEPTPTKGELPMEPEAGLAEAEAGLVPGAYVPQLVKLEEKSVTCGICLGAIKTGLNAAQCKCGKLYHDTCAVRVGECPKCDTKFDKEALKAVIDKGVPEGEPGAEEAEEDFSDMTEFQEPVAEKPEKPPKKASVPPDEQSPMEILKQRLAKGEIDLDTYKAMKKELE